MTFLVCCPNCGDRPQTEFSCDGEIKASAVNRVETSLGNFERVWLRSNVAGPHKERWFHRGGCRRWLTLTRNTTGT